MAFSQPLVLIIFPTEETNKLQHGKQIKISKLIIIFHLNLSERKNYFLDSEEQTPKIDILHAIKMQIGRFAGAEVNSLVVYPTEIV